MSRAIFSSTYFINAMIRDEAALPDHALIEGSFEKQKRNFLRFELAMFIWLLHHPKTTPAYAGALAMKKTHPLNSHHPLMRYQG